MTGSNLKSRSRFFVEWHEMVGMSIGKRFVEQPSSNFVVSQFLVDFSHHLLNSPHYPHMPIGMLEIYRLLFVFRFFGFFLFVRRIFGNGYLGRGLTQGHEILQDGRSRRLYQVISPFGELWPKG